MRWFAILSLLFSGCTSAVMVNRRGDSVSQYAPTNEKLNHGGMIKYLNQGYKGIIKKRRENSYKQMYQSCNGPYRITSEGQRAEGGSALIVPGPLSGVVYESSQWWYIAFECEPNS